MPKSGRVIRRMVFGFLTIILLLIFLDLFTFRNYRKSTEATELNMHSYQVIIESNHLLEALLNIETGKRGFLLTGKEPFLEPLEQGVASFEEHHALIMELTDSSPDHQQRLAILFEAYTDWYSRVVEPLIERRREMAQGLMLNELSLFFIEEQEESKALMDDMRELLGVIQHKEHMQLIGRQEKMMAISKRNTYFIIIGMAVISILAFFVAFRIIRNVYIYIRERNQAEKELNTERLHFEQLFQSIPLGVVLLDRNDRVIDLNQGFADLFRITKKEAVGQPINDLIVPDELKDEGTDTTEKVASGQSIYFETIRKRKDDQRIDVAIKGKPLDMQAGQLAVIGVYQDITERKRADEILRRSEQSFRELNADKDKFFSILAHDLRNPFNSIIGFSELLVDRIKHKELDGIDKYAHQILRTSKNTYELLSNLLAWARLQTGRIDLNNETFNLNSILDESLMLFSETAAEKSITLRRKTIPGIQVTADKTVVGTIMRNLISNAVKFTNPGGTVTIGSEMKDSEVVVWVSDTGIGMNQQMVKELFDPGKNTNRNGTGGEPSTGLGLLLAKEFVEKQGGKIWAESTEVSGSVFYFSVSAKSSE